MSSRDINDLLPKVAGLCRAFVEECRENGIDVIITSTVRTMEEQNDLYAQGRTKPGKRVTNAKAGQSYHNHRCAFDFCPVVAGKAMWNDSATFIKCGEIAESLGLEWAGRWKTMKELAHCQYTGGLTIADLQSGKMIS
jgi:peptidoglycan L-alanyl-D-glutamate endopeptidase CwlK